jgi:multicomponent Na+:H+ antiporter subunit D
LSKWYLALGSLDANQWPILVVLLTSSLLNAFYFLPIVFKAFFNPAEPGSEASPGLAEAPAWCMVPPVITAAGSIALFFYPDVFLNLARLALG